jgi:hypothetical protein
MTMKKLSGWTEQSLVVAWNMLAAKQADLAIQEHIEWVCQRRVSRRMISDLRMRYEKRLPPPRAKHADGQYRMMTNLWRPPPRMQWTSIAAERPEHVA